jgi:type IV secretory pathway VirB10-like protein
MALVAIAAGVIGAAAALWIFGGGETASTDAAIVEGLPIEAATPPATPVDARTPADDRATAPTPEAPPRQEPAPADAGQTVTTSAPAVAVAKDAVIDSDGNRVFVMEAELGYASLSLGFIVARSTNAFAEINGTEVRIGSRIEGFVVEAIEADRVILRDDKGLLILRAP